MPFDERAPIALIPTLEQVRVPAGIVDREGLVTWENGAARTADYEVDVVTPDGRQRRAEISSKETVRNHIRHLFAALGAHSRLEAIAIAHRQGLLS